MATEAEDDGAGIGRERQGEGVRQRCCRSSTVGKAGRDEEGGGLGVVWSKARCQQGHFGNFITGVLL